jgi:hypothetical protein
MMPKPYMLRLSGSIVQAFLALAAILVLLCIYSFGYIERQEPPVAIYFSFFQILAVFRLGGWYPDPTRSGWVVDISNSNDVIVQIGVRRRNLQKIKTACVSARFKSPHEISFWG